MPRTGARGGGPKSKNSAPESVGADGGIGEGAATSGSGQLRTITTAPAQAAHLDELGARSWSTRVGEASHPGTSSSWDDEGCFNIGTMNPTGLNGKAAYCSGLPPGILNVSESHLSSKGVAQFRLGLKLSRAKHKYLAGAHVPLRAHSFSSGGYSGVGFLSTLPQRSLPQSWPCGIQQGSRSLLC